MSKTFSKNLNKLFDSLNYEISKEEKLISKKLLAKFNGFSDWTKEHSERVGKMSKDFALYLGASHTAANNLEIAASLHDTGKLNVPKEFLNTTTPLNKNQFEKYLKPHSKNGRVILEKEFTSFNTPFSKAVLDICTDHHEKCNGTGYPNGKKKDDIALAAQIVSFCDIFDAMNYTRPYQQEFSQGTILCRMIDDNDSVFKNTLNKELLHSFVSFKLSEYNKIKNNENRDKITTEQLEKLESFCTKNFNNNVIIKNLIKQKSLSK